jgi:hypothetical protein
MGHRGLRHLAEEVNSQITKEMKSRPKPVNTMIAPLAILTPLHTAHQGMRP